MKERGQFSLDFLLAITAVFTFIIVLQIIAGSLLPLQAEQSVILQEKQIARKIAGLITESAILGDGDGTIEYAIPLLSIPGKQGLQTCSVEIQGNEVVVQFELDGKVLEETALLTKPSTSNYELNWNCGETLEITVTRGVFA